MTGSDLKDNAIAIWGFRGWQARLSETLGVFPSTVRRWVNGQLVVPKWAAAYVRLRMQYEVLLKQLEVFE